MRPRLSVPVFAAVLALAIAAQAQHGALTMPRNLAELTDHAAVIVEGHVLTAVAEPHPDFPNLMTVVVTIAVQDALKGKPGKLYTFRQFVWDIKDAHDLLGYRKGQHVLLMMNPENQHGLTSTVGLQQGRFRIVDGPDGQPVATNGQDNVGLFEGVAATAAGKGVQFSKRGAQVVSSPPRGPVHLSDLKEIIRGLVNSQ